MSHVRAIGLDIGTTTICAIVLDAMTGEILETMTEQNGAGIESVHLWEKLQDASLISRQAEKMIDQLTKKHAPIACIGVTGQMHGIVYIDEQGNAVSPLISWQDGRGDILYKDGLSYAEYLSKVTGYKLATGFGAVTHFYNTINHLVPVSAKYFCTIMDYVGMKLTNTLQPLSHPSNAASIGLYHVESNCFDKEAIKKAKMDEAIFPNVSNAGELLGVTSLEVPVAAAIGDNQASFIGSVRNNEECLLINIGTSSQISVFTHTFNKNSKVEIRPLIEDGFILVGSPLCGGRAYALLESFFREIAERASGKESPKLYNLMESLAGDFSKIHNPLKISTQFCGTRENPSLRGKISNLGTDNFTPGHFTVGVLQGMVQELNDLYQMMKLEQAIVPKMMIGSGNALRMNRVLQQMISEVFGMPLHIPVYKEEASYGAALFALTQIRFFKNIQEAQSLIQYET
ncbi:MAG: hypothetical protein K0S71_2151 [Clostridia bacterium]|jgi:sedoheptulokinase|nr:hypothetical protein [Clostridia bacterium]